MKVLKKTRLELQKAGRWDVDFHLPPLGILAFPKEILKRVDQVAEIAKDKRDPTKQPDQTFQYLDISSVDVTVGSVTNPQDVEGLEAPSRARKVVRAFDLLISTCRPTRGAVAVVPKKYHDQIASTGFSIVRANSDVNPFYLQFALRLPSTLEQFRKWSTGSSYPAILDEDVAKTMIPVPSAPEQDRIAKLVVDALRVRAESMKTANGAWAETLNAITALLSGVPVAPSGSTVEDVEEAVQMTIADIQAVIKSLPPLTTDRNGQGADDELEALFL
jgi:Type I restriction modification DNA specificity domain